MTTIAHLHEQLERITHDAMVAWLPSATPPVVRSYWHDTAEAMPTPAAVIELVDMQPDDAPSAPDGRALFDARFGITVLLDPLQAYSVGGTVVTADMAVRELAAHIWVALHQRHRLPDCGPFVFARLSDF